MHHRRSRTLRRENHRADSKAFRMAEKEALDRPPSVPPSDCWGRGAELPVPDDAPSTGRSRGKKITKKKEKCPAGKAHEWYKEEVTVSEWAYPYSWENRRPYLVEHTRIVWTCINCWKAHTPRTRRVYKGWRVRYNRSSWRTTKLVLPKRPIKELDESSW